MTSEKTNMDHSNITESTRITASKDTVYSELDGEAVILNLYDGLYYGLNQVGLQIWELIQSTKSLGEILDVLTAEYEVERNVCQADLSTMLAELAGKNLVEISNAG